MNRSVCKILTKRCWIANLLSFCFMFLLLAMGGQKLAAQVTVSVTGGANATPSLAGSYTSLTNAITALNAVTSFSGPVTLTCAAGNETAPAGGYALQFSAATSAVNNVTITTSGAVTLTASAAQPAGALNDAIIKLLGSDWVTISGFTMQENPANNTSAQASNNMTEWGVALLCPSTTNGSQNNTIQNNTISLKRSYVNSCALYSNVRHTPTNVNQTATTVSPSAPSGANKGNKVYGNTISNANYGIVFIGAQSYVTSFATMDGGNDIGGNSATTGNTLSNCGGDVASADYIDILSIPYCVHLRNQTDFNLSYNTITSATFTTTAPLAGIYITGSPANDNSSFSQNITHNTLTVTSTGNTSYPNVLGILHENLNSTLPNATVNISDNTLLNCQSATSFIGIDFSSARPGTCNINNNIFQGTTVANDFTAVLTSGTTGLNVSSPLMNVNNNRIQGTVITGTSGIFTGFNINGGVPNTLNVNANLFGTPANNAVTFAAGSGGSFRGIDISFASSTGTVNIQNNDFRGITHSGPSSTSHTFIGLGFPATSDAPLNLNASGNTFANLSLNTDGQVVFFDHSYAMPINGTQVFNNNSIVTAFSSNGGTVIIFSNFNSASPNTASVSYTNNNFSNVTSGSQLYGIYSNNQASVTSKTVTGNTFSNWTFSGACVPILLNGWGGGTINTVSNNTVSSINAPAGGAIAAISLGFFSGTNPLTVSNNTVSGLTVTGSGSVSGIVFGGTPAITGTTLNVFDNTVRNLSSGNTSLMSGIQCGDASVRNIYNNAISDLSCSANGSNILAGIYLTISSPNNSTSNIYNNRIGNITGSQLQGTNAIRGISIDETGAATAATVNVYYNTIYLNGLTSSGATFGASGIFANTLPTLKLINNLVWISGTANGGGRLAAYRRSGATLTSYAAASNNNMFYAGAPGANNLIYVEGVSAAAYTNPMQTLSAYQAFMATRDQASTSGTPSFLSTSALSTDFLKLNSGGNLVGVDNAGTPVVGITADFEGDTRAATPDIGADEVNSLPPPNFCNADGNLIIYSNYDGGVLNINVDQNIPNLKIGVTTYAAAQINLSGPFVGNVTQVIYAGNNVSNNNCGPAINTTTVNGVNPAIVQILIAPQVGYTPVHAFGYPIMIGGYQCDTLISSGGVNTPDEIVYYFTNATGGTLLYHQTQYNCWVNETLNVSAGGNCCIEPANNEGCPPISVNVTSLTDATCFDASNGAATVQASGGESPYTYNWQPVNLNGAAQNALAAGSYTVNVADQNGCPGTTTVTIDEPPQAIDLSINTVDAGCNVNNGSATVTASGGAPGYTYSWFPSGVSLPTINNLAPGIYSVTVTDGQGCTATANTTVSEVGCSGFCNETGNLIIYSNYDGGVLNINVDQDIPNLKIGISTYEAVEINFSGPFVSNVTQVIYAGFDAENDNCGLGVTSTTVTGVNSNIVQILFAPPVGYSPAHGFGNAIMLGADDCDTTMETGGNNTPDQIVYYFANATGGTLLYHDTQYGCWSGTRNVSNGGNCCIEPPNEDDCPSITISATSTTNVSCFGDSTGSATLTAAGGLAPYTYEWSPGNLSGPTQNNLAAGTYAVTVSDANNCPGSFTLNITQPATALQVSTTTVDAECGLSNGSATATASGGTAPYAYSWSPLGGNTAVAANLAAGEYVVEVSDNNGCLRSDTVIIINPGAPDAPTATVTQQPTCQQPTGAISISAPVGAEIQYSVGGAYQTSTQFSGLPPGTYSVTAQDASNGCISPASTLVLDSLPTLLIGETVSDVVCGSSAGAISLVVTGGSAPYTYDWTPGNASGSSLTNLAAGTYSVSVTDADGCVAAATFEVDTIGALAVSITPPSATINLGDTISLSASGGTTFIWTPEESLSCQVCSSLLAWPQETTTYQIVSSDSLGCRGFATVTIEVDIECNEAFVPTIFSPNGKGPDANETLCLFSNCADQLKFVIHNRWGQKVFETEDITTCWDGTFNGTDSPSGVYAFNLYILQINGEVVNKTGTITLVR